MDKFPPSVIPATETRILRSSVIGQEYLVSVALPFPYAERPEKSYPVIYVLDANLFFGMVVEMVRVMNVRVPFCNELPDAIIVGVGYPANGSLVEAHAQVMHLRMRDFLPLRSEDAEKFIQETFPVPSPIQSGEAGHFLQFIEQELMPLIEAEYRADSNDRTLIGHSWGGLFALYALFHHPHLFRRQVVISPDLQYSQGVIFDHEQTYAKQHNNLPVRLYLAYGESEVNAYTRPTVQRFLSILDSRQYAGLTLTYRLIAKCTHCAVVAPAFQAGLVAVFSQDCHEPANDHRQPLV